jgi:nitroreductase
MTVKQPTSSEGAWVLGAAVTTAASATTLYPSLWLPLAAVAAAALVLGGLVRAVLSAFSGSSGKASSTQVLDLIKSRRSVYPKDFSAHTSDITQQQLELMLEAARWAPTHKLTEPWHFVVLSGTTKSEFEELTIKCCQELLPPEKAEQVVAKLKRKQNKDWPKVHCYIAICMKRHEEVPEWEEIAAVSCGVQNLSLMAHSLGVSGYWSSWQAAARDSAAMHQFLGLDSSRGDRCLGVWLVGQADQERVRGYRPKRQDLAQKVVWKS